MGEEIYSEETTESVEGNQISVDMATSPTSSTVTTVMPHPPETPRNSFVISQSMPATSSPPTSTSATSTPRSCKECLRRSQNCRNLRKANIKLKRKVAELRHLTKELKSVSSDALKWTLHRFIQCLDSTVFGWCDSFNNFM